MSTARQHRELDRRSRLQHHRPLTFRERLADVVHNGGDALRGYHKCLCAACGDFRVHSARTHIKDIIKGL